MSWLWARGFGQCVAAMNGRRRAWMYDNQREVLRAMEQRFPYGEQDAWGNSIASLRANLKLAPIERLRKAERAAKSLMELKHALKRIS